MQTERLESVTNSVVRREVAFVNVSSEQGGQGYETRCPINGSLPGCAMAAMLWCKAPGTM